MKKVTLSAIGNSENFNYYIFKKNKTLLKKLDEIFQEINNSLIPGFSYTEKLKKNKEIIKKVNIFKIKDCHKSYSKKNVKIDIFYGDKNIFLILHCGQKTRLKFNEAIKKIVKIPKPKNVK